MSSKQILAATFAVESLHANAALLAFQEAVLADNPIAHYQFNELINAKTAIDTAGANNGTYSSTGVLLNRRGIGGGDRAAQFEGLAGTRMVVPNKEELNPPRITLEALAESIEQPRAD